MQPYISGPHRRYTNSEVVRLFEQRSGMSFRAFAGLLALWHRRWRTRRAMARDMRTFNDAMFEDFATTREEARAEVAKPFWKA